MALNIDLDGFAFLSDSEETSKLSPSIKQQQPPVSPIESESSSGISSLDSDDLKKQLLSSPAISHDDEDQHSDGGSIEAASTDKGKDTEDEATNDEPEDNDDDDDDDDEEEEAKQQREKDEGEKLEQIENAEADTSTSSIMKDVEALFKEEGDIDEHEDKMMEKQILKVIESPVKVIYQKRDILDLNKNCLGSFVQYTVLPDNNVHCFFQNRAQYWRLSSGERQEYSLEKCPCCDFTHPPSQYPITPAMKLAANSPNAITEALITWQKNYERSCSPMSNNNNNDNHHMTLAKRYTGCGGHSHSMQQPQQAPPAHQAPQYPQPAGNGFFNNHTNNISNNNGFNNYINNQQQQQQQMNPNQFMNNNGGTYGTTLALLNLMNNASRTAATAFQAMSSSNNTPRYYNNNNMNNNNGYGLYKQF